MEREREAVRVEHSPTRCPFCKDELADLKAIVACAACGARHHESCHDSHGACASCGSTEKLVPAAPRQRSRGDPLAGSKIRVSRTADATEYVWQAGGPGDVAVAIAFALLVVTLPISIMILLAYLRSRERAVRVTRDFIEFRSAPGGFSGKPVRAAREEVGKIHTATVQGGTILTIDVGMKRHILRTALAFVPSLTPPELEWLADQLNAWKEGGLP